MTVVKYFVFSCIFESVLLLRSLRFSFVDDKVCVIGIFGKGSVGYRSKATHVNSAIDKEVFKVGVLIMLCSRHLCLGMN